MMDYLIVIGKTLLFLVVIILILKIMGKRELGQLNSFDIVIFFMISELFSLSIDSSDESIWLSLTPIFIIFLMQILTSYVVLKSNKLRKMIEENPTFIINNGVLDVKAMRKLRYNIDDLMEQIRTNGVDSLSNVKFAVLESNGQLSVIKNGDEKSVVPFPVIKDGKIDNKVLKVLNKDQKWLVNKIKENGFSDVSQIFLCLLEKNDQLYVIEKDEN